MTNSNAPESLPGDPGASDSKGGRLGRLVARPWFWILLLCCFWFPPLLKSLSLDFPEPVPGADRRAEVFELEEEKGERVSCEDLRGHLKVVQVLDLGSPQSAEQGFAAFRERKKRLRGLGSLVAHLVLVENSDSGSLSSFLDEKTARKPSNLFLIDDGGQVMAELRESAGKPDAVAIVLDRHGRLRGAYGSAEAEGNRFAQDLASLANWVGSDPEFGEAVTR